MQKPGRVGRLVEWLGLEFIQLTPLDVRVLIRLAAFLAVWKLLSVDLSALAGLARGAPLYLLPEPLTGLMPALQWFFARRSAAPLMQWCAIVSLTLFMVRLQRPFLLIGTAAGVALELCCYLYRGNLFQLELPLALLFFVAVYPTPASQLRDLERWQDCPGGRSLLLLGQLLVLYIAGAYFTTGLSKLLFDIRWHQIVGLEYLYPFTQIRYLCQPLGVIKPIAVAFHETLAAWPRLGELLGLLTLIGELGWILVPFVRRARLPIPLLMLSIHFGIFASGGPLFLSMAALQGCVMVDWARLRRRTTVAVVVAAAASDVGLPSLRQHAFRVSASVVVLLAVVYPALIASSCGPFANYNFFGWSYRQAALKREPFVYALGCHDAVTGRVTPVSMYNGGFMDFKLASIAAFHVENYFTVQQPSHRWAALAILNKLAFAIRPWGSNETLLGPFNFPVNMPCQNVTCPVSGSRVYLMRGEVALQQGLPMVIWKSLIPLDRVNPQLRPDMEEAESTVPSVPFRLEDSELTRKLVAELRGE